MFNSNMPDKEHNLTHEEFAQLEKEIREEFPNDEMMFELHLARALEAYRSGLITKEQLLAKERKTSDELEPL